jgi:hypothetical protein
MRAAILERHQFLLEADHDPTPAQQHHAKRPLIDLSRQPDRMPGMGKGWRFVVHRTKHYRR